MWRRSSNRLASSKKPPRLRFESLEPRALLDAAQPWEIAASAPADSVGDVVLLAADQRSAAEQPGVSLESDFRPQPPPDKIPEGDEPPLKAEAEVVLERAFLTGVLKITAFSKFAQRIQIDAPRKGISNGLTPYVRAVTIYGYEDHGDYVVFYPDQEVRGWPRASIEYHFDGRERSVRYNGPSQMYVQERLHFVNESTQSLSNKGLFAESYALSTAELRLYQRSEDVYDQFGRKASTRTEHFAHNGDSLVLDVGAVEGGTAEVTLGEERYAFSFEERVQVDKQWYFDQNTYSLKGARAVLSSSEVGRELAKVTFDPQTIKFEIVPEETALASQPFGVGSVEIFELRTVAFDRAEKRARVTAPHPRGGRPQELLLLEQVSAFEVDEQGSLVVRNVEASRKTSYVFQPDGAMRRTELSGPLVRSTFRELWADDRGVELQLTREQWAREEDGGLRAKQDRILSRNAKGELSFETYVRYVSAEERLIWVRSLYDRVQPVWLSYVSQSRAETLELVEVTQVAFDQFGWVASLEALHRYEPELLQRMIELRVDDSGLHASFRLDPRPMHLRRAFGEGELLIEQRPNLDSFVYLLDAQGNLILEKKIESFSINSEYVLVVYDDERSLIRRNGTIEAVTFVARGAERIEIRNTLSLVHTGDASRLTALERGWYLESRELQKETYEYAADGSLLETRLERNPLEWLVGDESPVATFTLDTRAAERTATMFLSYTRTGALRDLGVRQIVFTAPPELVRDEAGLVQMVHGKESAPGGEPRFVQLEFSTSDARLNERRLFETRFGNAADERLARISVLEYFDQQGGKTLLFRLSGQPLAAALGDWHPFDVFFADQPLVEYVISAWNWTGRQLDLTLADGSRLAAWADETSMAFDSERTWDSDAGLLTTRISARPTYNYGPGEGLVLVPFRQEIVAADGRVLQSEHTTYRAPLLGTPDVDSRSLVWRLADGRIVEYRQSAQVHLLTVTPPGDPDARKTYLLLGAPRFERLAAAGLAARLSGQVESPAGPQDFSLELFE